MGAQQGRQQASVRAVTGRHEAFNGDWHGLFDIAGIPAGAFEGRFIAYVNIKLSKSYTSYTEAAQALATAYGAYNLSSLGTFTASVTPWTPSDLGSKLKAWWDAPSVSNTTLNGSTIASWTDSVGSYVLAQGTAANQPAYSATGWTGSLSCAVFDGSNDSLVLDTIPAGIPTGSTASEIWMQARCDVASGDASTDVGFDMGATASASADRRTLARISGNLGVVGYDGVTINGPAATVGGVHVWRGIYNATSGRLDLDRTAGTATTGLTPTTGTARIRMGGTTFSTTQGPWNGAIRRILITEPLTDTEAGQLYTWLG